MNSLTTRSKKAMEDYLKAIYLRQKATGQPVRTTDIAARLAVTPASATGMIKRLARLKLVRHVPYHGVTLTPSGTRIAERILHNHELLQCFLMEFLHYSEKAAAAEADELEHVISAVFATSLAAQLGDLTSAGKLKQDVAQHVYQTVGRPVTQPTFHLRTRRATRHPVESLAR